MSYNPVSSTVSSDIKAEAAIYSVLYQTQYKKHIRYSWILWAGIAGIFVVLCAYRALKVSRRPWIGKLERLCGLRSLYGLDLHTTRLQFLLLLAYSTYNILVSFVDIPYGHSYRYTSKHAPGYVQKATTMQFIADRTGYLAFASMPLVFLLVTRYSLISLCSGIPYTSFGLLHRWIGWTVFILSWLHTLLWTIEMGVNYHMTGGYLATRWSMRYWLGGFFASLFMTWLILHSIPMVRRYTGYEFFRITHNLGSILLVIGCWVHWPQESRWLIACLAVYYSDRIARWSLIALRGWRSRGRTTLVGTVHTDNDDISVAVVDITHTGIKSWTVGQHIYIYCVSLGEWEPHPFSVANTGRGQDKLKLIIRKKSGLTNELVNHLWATKEPVSVLIDGPYGALDTALTADRHLLLVMGGTGISFALSALHSCSTTSVRSIRLVWFVRRQCNVSWVEDELRTLSQKFGSILQIDVVVSRERVVQNQIVSSDAIYATEKSPAMALLDTESARISHRGSDDAVSKAISEFVTSCDHGPITILGCGPVSMSKEIECCAERLNRTRTSDIRWHVEKYMI